VAWARGARRWVRGGPARATAPDDDDGEGGSTYRLQLTSKATAPTWNK